MRNFFVSIYRFFERHRIALWTAIALLIAVFVAGILRLHFVEDIGSFFPDKGDNRRVNYAYQHIGSDNRIVLNIKLSQQKDSLTDEDYATLTAAADSLAHRLKANDTEHLMKDLTYQVDQIKVIVPEDSSDLVLFPGKDYCTLMTCTPYGINTHRLLVRGIRVENDKELLDVRVTADALKIDPLYVVPFIAGPVLLLMIIWVVLFAGRRRRSRY